MERLFAVGLDAIASKVQQTELELAIGVTGLRERFERAECRGKVTPLARGKSILKLP